MKKLIAILLCAAAILPLALCGCGKTGKNEIPAIKLDYVKDLMVNTNGVTAFGIKKEAGQTGNKLDAGRTSGTAALNLFSPISTSLFIAYAEEAAPARNYLYSTTEIFSNGDVEFDEGGISKVTFRKNTEKTEEIYDANGNRISSDTEITQDEIPAQVNKVYTTGEFTFIQFVALVKESGFYSYKDEDGKVKSEELKLRPDSLRYDEYGVSDFDRSDYYSGALSQSFVISNETGYIYKLEDVRIDGFRNGLVVIDGSFYRIYIENQNLCLEDVLPNKEIEVSSVCKDAYGWVFVANDTINEVDSAKKIIYTTDRSLVHDQQYVYVTECLSPLFRTHVVKKYENGTAVDIVRSVRLTNLYYVFDNEIEFHTGYIGQEWNGITILKENDSTFAVYDADDRENYALVNGCFVDGLYDLFYFLDEENHLFGQTLSFGDRNETVFSDPVALSEKTLTKETDFYLTVGSDSYLTLNVFSAKTVSGTSYYQVCKEGGALTLRLLNEKNYSDRVYIFQPINK